MPKTVRPIFCTVNKSPVAAMTPMPQGPLSVAAGFAAGLTFGAGFLPPDLMVGAIGGAGWVSAQTGAARHHSASAITKGRNIRDGTTAERGWGYSPGGLELEGVRTARKRKMDFRCGHR